MLPAAALPLQDAPLETWWRRHSSTRPSRSTPRAACICHGVWAAAALGRESADASQWPWWPFEVRICSTEVAKGCHGEPDSFEKKKKKNNQNPWLVSLKYSS